MDKLDLLEEIFVFFTFLPVFRACFVPRTESLESQSRSQILDFDKIAWWQMLLDHGLSSLSRKTWQSWWQSGRVPVFSCGYDMNITILIHAFKKKKVMFGMYNHICTYYLSRTMGDGSLSRYVWSIIYGWYELWYEFVRDSVSGLCSHIKWPLNFMSKWPRYIFGDTWYFHLFSDINFTQPSGYPLVN